ncbi:ricin-type beta-trefoil lectin domain protein [Endozoicomonas sp. SM1973]|uniref:Ricin-type beta-trefoil lectin domain protein n=1 Tax=Spartinivicinus marinus TaxID=2994442 RepID=A0A853IK71_9GAMM|nr:RICIN domain-containing protein [Spartinivicinus marinus]NYZ69777.1 ricin-type beta-trefoil lectin domain protein [Spartinivicinus marinus]
MKASHLLPAALLSLSVSAVQSANAAEYQQLKSGNGLCLDVFGSQTADKTPVTPNSCHGGADQQWLMDSLGRLHPKNAPDKCLEVGPYVTYNKTAYIAQCNNEMYQRWRWSGNTLQNQSNPYMVLDYYADRQLIGAWQFHGGPNQQWQWVKSAKPTTTTTTTTKKPTQTEDVRDIMISVNLWGQYENRGWEGQSKIREKGDFKLYNAVLYLDRVEGYDLGNTSGFQRNRSLDPRHIMTKRTVLHKHDRRDDQQVKLHSKQLLAFFKEYLNKVVAKEKRFYPNKNLRFSLLVRSHGGPNRGEMFEHRLLAEDARELLNYIKEISGQKLALLDLSLLCNEAFWSNISNFYPYAEYILASEYLSGGLTGKYTPGAAHVTENYYPEGFSQKLSIKDIAVNRLNKTKQLDYPNYTIPSRKGSPVQKSKTLFDTSKVENFVCSLKGIQGDLIPEKHHEENFVHDVKKYLLALKAHGTNDQNKINKALKAYDNLVIHHITNEDAHPETWSKYRSYGLSIFPSHYTNPVGRDLFESFSEVMHQKPQCN